MLILPPGYDLEIWNPVGTTVPASACKQLGEWDGEQDVAVGLHFSLPTMGAMGSCCYGLCMGKRLPLVAFAGLSNQRKEGGQSTPFTHHCREAGVGGSSAYKAAQWESDSREMTVIRFNLFKQSKKSYRSP